MHEDNLKTLYDFMINKLTDEQIGLINKIAAGEERIPEINPLLSSAGMVFASMPIIREKIFC